MQKVGMFAPAHKHLTYNRCRFLYVPSYRWIIRETSVMAELFVYNWVYTGYNVYGHCLNAGGKYVLLTVRGFRPSCYVEGETVPRSTVVPLEAEYRRMATSRDISSLRPFHRLYFDSTKQMNEFISDSFHGSGTRVRPYMADIQHISVFLSQTGADYVGWVRVPGPSFCPPLPLPQEGCNNPIKGSSIVCKQDDIVPLPERIPYSSPRVMAFDIEVKSSDLGMPQPHRIEDTVEMISVVVFECGKECAAKRYILHTLDEPIFANCEEDNIEDVIYDDEAGLITGFFELITQENPTVITGFNIFGFDIHYMISRLRLRLLDIPDASRGIKRSVDIIRVDWASDAYGRTSSTGWS